MKSVKLFFWSVMVFCSSFICLAGAQPPSVQLNADYACFRYDDMAVFVEVYYSVKGAPQASMKLSVSRNDTAYTENQWTNSGDDAMKEEDTVLGRVYFVAPEGNYRWTLTASDGASSLRRDSVVFQRSIRPFEGNVLGLSDIEIASSIQFGQDVSASSPFFKNSMIVVPNPALQAGGRQNLLYFYVELYNVLSGIPGEKYAAKVAILDDAQSPVPGMRPITRKKKKTNASVADFGEMGLFGLAPGRYLLSYAVLDSTGRVLQEKHKRFWMAGQPQESGMPQNTRPEPQFEISPFAVMDESVLNQEYECARYLMTDPQRKLFSNLKNLDAKRKWLYDFWSRAPAILSVNFEEYHKRIDEANTLYGTFQTAGWKTDRGRVFMTYGKPNDTERFPSSSQMAPYEIWDYDAIEGGVIFVFADLSGYKNYTLLHSTKRGEVYNPEYETQLKSGY